MRNWALVVGINKYPGSANQTVLKGAVADAADFADWALHPNGGAVAPADLFFWTHPAPSTDDLSLRLANYLAAPTPWSDPAPSDAPNPTIKPMSVGRAPTAPEIARTAANAARAAKKASGPQRIYVFFAGHGLQIAAASSSQASQTCFIAADFQNGPITSGAIPCDELLNGLQNLGFSEVIMFLDCCRTQLPAITATAHLDFMNVPASMTKPAFSIGRAADWGALAFETPEGDERRGAFSQVLLEGLRRHRDDAKELLTLNALEAYVETSIGAVVKPPREQYPQFQIQPRNPKFALLRAPKIDPLLGLTVNFSEAFDAVVLRDGKTREIKLFKSVAAGSAEKIVVEAGGFYCLETLDKTRVVTFAHSGPDETNVQF